MARQLITIEVGFSLSEEDGWPEYRMPPAEWNYEGALDEVYDEEVYEGKEYPYATKYVHLVQAGPVVLEPGDAGYIGSD